ncbi:MAG: aldolase/citrate lyase family protein [Pirellulaceae bacterium]|jgi:2-dehydro-3-deoxyglucarate aldolase/4-hydroxy-2-oxoheptanedioate aldolase|nr:aldolase/citrate lyase family protein [Pirellulaceae bacterium]
MVATFRERLAGDGLLRTFAIGRVVNPVVVEMFGLAGDYDGFWLDQEHAIISTEQILTAAMAARANDMDCFVRVAPTGYSAVTQCLEAGAGGVMAAQIHSAEQAEQFVQWAKFAPRGGRGLNLSGYDAHYSHTPAVEFIERANATNFVAIQIETLGAVEEADQIAAIDGVDLLFVGPADLSLSLGVVGQFHCDKLWEAIGAVAAACQKHGKNWGAVTPDPKFAERAVELGCRMPTMGNDVLALRRGIEALKKAFQAQFPA